MKNTLQTKADQLADLCLSEAQIHHGYGKQDLMNASLIFSHFLMDLLYTKTKHMEQEKQLDLAESTGKAIRELIKTTTGYDMHEVAKNL